MAKPICSDCCKNVYLVAEFCAGKSGGNRISAKTDCIILSDSFFIARWHVICHHCQIYIGVTDKE